MDLRKSPSMKALPKVLTSLYIFYSFSAVATIIPSGFGSESNFYDNGLVTTEYENGVAVREWLDLTITNGISYSSLAADLEDDGILNGSPKFFSGNAGALSDISNLTLGQSQGWMSASSQQLNSLIDTFLGISYNPTRGTHIFRDDDGYRTYIPIVGSFVQLFGDTFNEGLADIGATPSNQPPSVEFNAGYTTPETYPPFNFRSFRVSGWSGGNNQIDSYSRNVITERYEIGTWLVRDVQIVSEPKTILILLLGLLVILVTPRLHHRHQLYPLPKP